MPLNPLNHSASQDITHISRNPTTHYHGHENLSFVPTAGQMKQTLALLNNPINKQETHVSDVDSIENTECLQQTFKNLLSFNDEMLLDKNHVFNSLCFNSELN